MLPFLKTAGHAIAGRPRANLLRVLGRCVGRRVLVGRVLRLLRMLVGALAPREPQSRNERNHQKPAGLPEEDLIFHAISLVTGLSSQLGRAQSAIHHQLVRLGYEKAERRFIPAFFWEAISSPEFLRDSSKPAHFEPEDPCRILPGRTSARKRPSTW